MAQPSPSVPRQPKRWYRSRKLIYLLILLLGCVAAWFAWDALFMPADLRRMQGTWKVVKILTNDDKRVNFGNEIEAIFAGRYLILNVPHRAPIEIQDGHFRIFDVPEDERTILGVTVQTPIWWRRPVRVIYGTYEFADQQLIFWLKGGKDLRDNTVEEREDQQLRVYLERR